MPWKASGCEAWKSCRLGRAGCVASLLWTVQFAGLLDESCFLCQKSGKPFSHPILRCENLFPHLFFCYIFQTSIEAWDHPLSSNSSWRHAPAESGVLDMAQNFLLMKCISLRSSAIPLGISMFYLKANTVVVTQYFLVRSSHLKNAQDKDVHTHFRFLWETYKVGNLHVLGLFKGDREGNWRNEISDEAWGGGHLATNDCVNFPNWNPSFLEIFQPMPKTPRWFSMCSNPTTA